MEWYHKDLGSVREVDAVRFTESRPYSSPNIHVLTISNVDTNILGRYTLQITKNNETLANDSILLVLNPGNTNFCIARSVSQRPRPAIHLHVCIPTYLLYYKYT